MNRIIKVLTGLLCIALLCSLASAETQTKDLPTKGQVISFLQTVPIDGSSYIEKASSMSVSENPTWKWDIWKAPAGNLLISFYYTDPASPAGYGSIYLDDYGSDITESKGLCKAKNTLIENYKGDKVIEETITPTEEIKEEKTSEDPTEEMEVKEEVPEKVDSSTDGIGEKVVQEGIDEHISKMSRGEKIDLVTKLLNMIWGDD